MSSNAAGVIASRKRLASFFSDSALCTLNFIDVFNSIGTMKARSLGKRLGRSPGTKFFFSSGVSGRGTKSGGFFGGSFTSGGSFGVDGFSFGSFGDGGDGKRGSVKTGCFGGMFGPFEGTCGGSLAGGDGSIC